MRILVVSLDNLGDLVFASALVPALREHHPDATIDVWCRPYTVEVAGLIPGVDDVLEGDPFYCRSAIGTVGTIGGFARSIRAVRRRGYDVAVLTSAPWRTAAATAAAGARMRIGFARGHNAPFLTHRLPAADRRRPVMEELGRLLEPLGIHASGLRYELDEAALTRAEGSVGALLPDPVVALHPFAASRDRCATLAMWLDVAAEVESWGYQVLWVGLRHELDELRAYDRDQHVRRYVDRIAQGSVRRASAAIGRADAFVGHDSGPLHLAGALGVPVVGVFAPGEPHRTFPQGVGPSRLIAVPTPAHVDGRDVLEALDELLRVGVGASQRSA